MKIARSVRTALLVVVAALATVALPGDALAQTIVLPDVVSAVTVSPPGAELAQTAVGVLPASTILSVYDDLERARLDVATLDRVDPGPREVRIRARAPSRPQTGPADTYPTWVKVLYWTSQGTVWATYTTDVATTHKAVELGASEGNLILRKKDGTPSYVLKSGMVVAESVGAHKLLYERGHPVLATLANGATSFAQGFATKNNFTNVTRLLERAGAGPPPAPARRVAVTVRF